VRLMAGGKVGRRVRRFCDFICLGRGDAERRTEKGARREAMTRGCSRREKASHSEGVVAWHGPDVGDQFIANNVGEKGIGTGGLNSSSDEKIQR